MKGGPASTSKRKFKSGQNVVDSVSYIKDSVYCFILIYSLAPKATEGITNFATDDNTMAADNDPIMPPAMPTSSEISPRRTYQMQWPLPADASPYAANITRVFPPFLCSAIIKDEWSRTKVQMSLPDNTDGDCQMILNILPSKVGYLAMTLFGTHVESEAERRYTVSDKGNRAVPSPSTILEGAEEKQVGDILGLPTSVAVQTSLKRGMEIRNGCALTGCVTMSFSIKPDDPAYLSIQLGEFESVKLRSLLFGF